MTPTSRNRPAPPMTDAQKRMLDYAQRIAYSSVETLMFTFEMAQKHADSKGCYVEAGVAAGAQIIALAAGAPNTKHIYALDSFEGIPLPSNKDNQMPGIRMLSEEEQAALPGPGEQALTSSGATIVNESDFWKHIHDSGVHAGNIMAIKGWFEKTTPDFAEGCEITGEKIAILRLDGDLYNSTYVCLKHLYPLVEPGGLVIIDDWELPGSNAAVMEYAASQRFTPYLQFVSNIAYFIKP